MQIPDIDLLSDFEESPSVACMLRVWETPLGVSGKPRVHHLKCLLIVRQESGSYFAAERLEMPENDVEFCRSWEDAKNFPNSYFPSLIDALSLMHSHNSHTHTHTHTHTYIYTHTHTHINIHTHTTHIYALTHIQTHTHTSA